MSDQEIFDLVFKGELVKGAELGTVKSNIGKLFKMAPEKVEALFSGKAITLKKGLDFDAANRYRVAIKKAGARVDLVEKKAPVQSAAPASVAPPVQRPADTGLQGGGQQRGEKQGGQKQGGQKQGGQKQGGEQQRGIGGAGTASAEASLSIRENSGNLVDATELSRPQDVVVDTSALSVADAEGDLLRPEEKVQHKPANVNVDQFSLAEPGAKLGPDRAPAPPAPDTSRLSLEDINE